MKKIKLVKILCTFIILCMAVLSGCNKETLSIKTEPIKDIVGSWKIVTLLRNNEDLTSRINLEKFRIIFNKDSTYTFQDKMAFVVMKPGTYSLDDPQYPFFLTLTPQDNAQANKIKLSLPIVGGKRQISITISPGCSLNSYQYVFEKVQ